jgi:hypothetical protein
MVPGTLSQSQLIILGLFLPLLWYNIYLTGIQIIIEKLHPLNRQPISESFISKEGKYG